MKFNREKAEKMFNSFLLSHNVQVGFVDDYSVMLDQLVPEGMPIPKLTKFKAFGDILLYSRLLSTLSSIIPSDCSTTLIGLGAGSSIPTINIFLNPNGCSNVQVLAVDNDTEAIAVGKGNVALLGVADKYTFAKADMLDFLSGWKIEKGCILASNPPFIPVPVGLNDPFYGPVDGGINGTKYLESLLLHPMPTGTIVVVRWCSLSDPCKIIKYIQQNYDILHIEANKTIFGPYTSLPPLRTYIEELGETPICIYSTDDNGDHSYISVECILRRR